MKLSQHKTNKWPLMLIILALHGCVSNLKDTDMSVQSKKYQVNVDASFLSTPVKNNVEQQVVSPAIQQEEQLPKDGSSFSRLNKLDVDRIKQFDQSTLSQQFSNVPTLNAVVENMPMRKFLHYVFGELLAVDYVFDDTLKLNADPLTLNIQGKISPRRLFELTSDLLSRKQVDIKKSQGVFLLYQQAKNAKSNIVASIGRSSADVPDTVQDILQIVPLSFGFNTSAERTLRDLVDVSVVLDHDQNVIFLRGKRNDILRALEFVDLLDTPANRGSYIGLIKLTYLNVSDFSNSVTTLLATEGVKVGQDNGAGKNVVLIPLMQLGAVAVFATSENLLQRVKYWAGVIDQPSEGTTEQYFVYNPSFARASDIGDSLSNLLSGSMQQSRPQTPNGIETTGNAPRQNSASGLQNSKMRMVVDERSNSIIFLTSGAEYQNILPLLTQLDVLPKQVVLDITIAEVSLQDEFKHGVEWALQQGETYLSTQGAFGASSIGGLSLVVDGLKGPLNANFLETNNLVNVISKPTLLVRDGMTANINVGSDISVVGSTTIDPINSSRQTTATTYRKTGVDVTVTPTINAKGVVIMEISQNISNSVPSSAGASGNPDIFERSIKTEVVAESGKTVLLGGLISENKNRDNSGAPGISKVPGLGWLFSSKGESTTRTELIMLITPRIVSELNEWESISEQFKQGLEYLNYQ